MTDAVAEQIQRAAQLINTYDINAASTGQRFVVKGENLSPEKLHQLAKRLLTNDVIQRYTLGSIFPSFPEDAHASESVEMIKIRGDIGREFIKNFSGTPRCIKSGRNVGNSRLLRKRKPRFNRCRV